ncbi:hypothetical protein BGW41_007287 [Actinomortierella wolfii]|nr:hypothetical protein BGW41_007287 [Actinomortierella wolfii]
MSGSPTNLPPSGSSSPAPDTLPTTQATSRSPSPGADVYAVNASFVAPSAAAASSVGDVLDSNAPGHLPFTIYEDHTSQEDELTPPLIRNRILPASLTQPVPRAPSPRRQRSPPPPRSPGRVRTSTKPARRVRFQPYDNVAFLVEQIEAATQRWDSLLRAKADTALLFDVSAQLTQLFNQHREAVALKSDPAVDIPLLRLSATLESYTTSGIRRRTPPQSSQAP